MEKKSHLVSAPSRQRRALIVVTSHNRLGSTGKSTGYYLSEVSHIYYPLVECGFEVEFASPLGGAAPMDENSRKVDDPHNARLLADPQIVDRLQRTLRLSAIEVREESARAPTREYDLVHFAGGHGTMWDFPSNPDVQRVVRAIYERGGFVAAVCHGPAALVDVKLSSGAYLVAGKEMATFTNAEEEAVGLTHVVPFLLQSKLEGQGARVVAAGNWQSQAVVSERLITGQNPQSAHAMGRAITELASSLDG